MKLPRRVECLLPPRRGNVNNRLRPEKVQSSCFRTGVRFPSAPPTIRYTNTVSNASFAVYRNVFGLIIKIDDYEDGTHLQIKRATYKEIQAWVKQQYGFHVSNLSISQTKERCGLSKTEYKGFEGAEGHYVPKLRPEKEAAIREAFRWFGLLEEK